MRFFVKRFETKTVEILEQAGQPSKLQWIKTYLLIRIHFEFFFAGKRSVLAQSDILRCHRLGLRLRLRQPIRLFFP